MGMNLPAELLKDVETVNQLIMFLKMQRKILKGKTVTSTKGFVNKFKFYMLGYVVTKKAQLCEKCGAIMKLNKTANKGTTVKFSQKGTEVLRDVEMPFNWLYFECSKCGWKLCTTDDADAYYRGKTHE